MDTCTYRCCDRKGEKDCACWREVYVIDISKTSDTTVLKEMR